MSLEVLENAVLSARSEFLKSNNPAHEKIVEAENFINSRASYSELMSLKEKTFLTSPAGTPRFYINLADLRPKIKKTRYDREAVNKLGVFLS